MSLHINPKSTMEPKYLKVDFYVAGSVSDIEGGKGRLLCQFELECTFIADKCPPNYGQGVNVEIAVQLPNQELKSGELTIEVVRKKIDRDYTNKKTYEIAKRLSNQLDIVAKFNEEHRGDPCLSPGGIRGRFGRSYIDAAIHLRNTSLVAKLLKLGARFYDDGGAESPLVKAKSFRDRTKKKLQDSEANGGDRDSIAARRQALADFEYMVDCVAKMATPLPASETTEAVHSD